MNKIIYLVLVAALIPACGAELAYKQGASARDLQASKAACQEAANEALLNQCLEDNGWAVQKLGEKWLSDDDLFATASETVDNRTTAPKAKKPEVLQTTASIKAEESIDKKVEPIETVSTSTETAPIKKDVEITKTSLKPTPNVLDTYVIKSWWKMGGGAALLEQNMNECSEALGAAHQPDKATFTFTRGFAICMREKGWRGLIEK